MTIPELLHAVRQSRCLTQAQLGALLNVSGNTIARWERGEYYPRRADLVRARLTGMLAAVRDPVPQDGTQTQGA
jgi:transcriptional regulator with XRE-family HTH domain